MVITGDLSDWGDRDDYEWLRAGSTSFPVPVRLCIGNHDRRATFLSVFPEYAEADGFAQGVHDTAAGRCLFLDTTEPRDPCRTLCTRGSIGWRRGCPNIAGPFLLFMHHNPMPTHLGPMDQIRLLDDAAFRQIVGRHRDKIRHIFFGHCHLPLGGSVAGIPATSLRGTNHASYPLFSEKS